VVITGLDPVIHDLARSIEALAGHVDGRIKSTAVRFPGNNHKWHNF
jgi:hypothetical protein